MLINFCLMMLIFSFFLKNLQILFIYSLFGGVLIFLFLKLSWKFYCFNSIYVFVDNLSVLLIFLSFIIIYFLLMMNYCKNCWFSMFMYLLLFFILVSCFSVSSFLNFYIFFEFSLVPLLYLILVGGGSLERFSSVIYLVMYTLSSSLLFLFVYLGVSGKFNVEILLVKFYFGCGVSSIFCLFLMLVFLVKVPMFLFHFWLPKAHVEASVEGSMILAAVLLKLGGFGLNRLFMFVSLFSLKYFVSLILSICLFGSFLVSLICLRQVDVKKMIAYSSVSHMGLLLGGMMSFSKMGLSGSAGMMLSHGFCSSALFYLGNMFYERCKTRNLFFFKGLIFLYPVTGIVWIIFSVFNMGAPFSMNFFSELFLVMAVLNKSLYYMFILSFILFFSVCYSLNLFLWGGHGEVYSIHYIQKETFLDFFVLFGHFIFMVIYIFKMSYFYILL